MKTLRNTLLCLTVLQLCPSFSYSSDGRAVSCCLKTSATMLPRAKIKDYHIQRKGLCPVEAVIFVTVKGKTLCSDPISPWAKKTMDYVNQRKKAHLTTTTSAIPLFTETLAISLNPTSTPGKHKQASFPLC